jgi:hypothetical protein
MNKRIGPLFFEKDPPEWRMWITILRADLNYPQYSRGYPTRVRALRSGDGLKASGTYGAH